MSASIASRSAWTAKLEEVKSKPLAFRPDFPAVAQMWEDWWQFKARRPLISLSVRKTDGIRWDKAFDLLDRPHEYLAVRRPQVEALHYVGDTLPNIRVDTGPVLVGPFLGAPLHFAHDEQTSWQDTTIENWDSASFRFDENNLWFRLVMETTRTVARDAAGKYLVSYPDLSGAIDTLANMRGSERLCFDLFEHREQVIEAAEKVVDVWDVAFAALHDIVLGAGAGPMQWLGMWSDAPYTVPTCDFNALIGKKDFSEICLPSLREQATRAGRCCLHLDGPAAANHAEALAQEPSMTAIQYTPGAGTPSALAKIDMLRMLQKAGKPIIVFCPADEVKVLCDKLDPAGLALLPEGVKTPQEADKLAREVIG